ncbi:MAG: hypothetical protein WBC02_02330, partial [Candidatus Aminicenantaceae bacterium]
KRFWETASATIEDLAFGFWLSREVDRVDLRVCISSGQWIQKTRNFCPSKINILTLRRPTG